jgi:epoxyqueuosine reductase
MKKDRISFIKDLRIIKNTFAVGKTRIVPEQPPFKLDENSLNVKIFDENWFIQRIQDLISNHPKNQMEGPHLTEEPIFESPIVGFVKGDDPIFEQYKQIIGPFHLTPYEILAWQAAKNHIPPPQPNEISVISFILPFSKKTIDSNAAETQWLSERWALN